MTTDGKFLAVGFTDYSKSDMKVLVYDQAAEKLNTIYEVSESEQIQDDTLSLPLTCKCSSQYENIQDICKTTYFALSDPESAVQNENIQDICKYILSPCLILNPVVKVEPTALSLHSSSRSLIRCF